MTASTSLGSRFYGKSPKPRLAAYFRNRNESLTKTSTIRPPLISTENDMASPSKLCASQVDLIYADVNSVVLLNSVNDV